MIWLSLYEQRLLELVEAAGEFGIWRPNHEGSAVRRMLREGWMRSRWHAAPAGSKEMLTITEAGRNAMAEFKEKK
jgi:DNA-binding PadR family transcriptional regulator